MNINFIYTSKLVTVNENEELSQADDLMNNYNIRHLPVVDNAGVLSGILSKSDFIALKYVDSRLKNFKVKEVMTSPVKAVRNTSTVREIASLFLNRKISSVIVVANDEAVGIVTTEDLIRLLLKNLDAASEAQQLDLVALADDGWISNTVTQQAVS